MSSVTSVASHSQPRGSYYDPQPAASPPNSSRRASRRPSNTGNGAPISSPSQPQYYSPNAQSQSSSSMTPGTTRPHSSHAGVSAAAPSGYPGEMRGAPVAPPRTSSNNRASMTATTDRQSSSRQGPYPGDDLWAQEQYQNGSRERGSSSRQANGASRDDVKSNTGRTQQGGHEQIPVRSGSDKPARENHAPAASRPNGPSREQSEVISRTVVSKPEEDIGRERERMAEAVPHGSEGTPMSPSKSENSEDARQSRVRSEHGSSSQKGGKNGKFGDYFLGNTLGEGEFGKVKMGWKQEGGVQVAVKLIRRDLAGTNPSRLGKIYREVNILREISHPNIVRLHEVVETDKHIGIVLEYASGGELFDYILHHRYLKDNSARRLFAQLVSGVGYLHKKGIVHRDLKLENLLLDRNRNIIITDFGFANSFDPLDELGDDIEYQLSNRDFVKKMELDKPGDSGYRRGDLMQTSCGSPCYAAPELVVSDSLYTGRKVDVWSCGVILYAMLAGYLPFDDDPANPEGDNINLLYKYIVSTPLTFPEYVTPHARDLLRRILVPDPRKRADLFEVARHSWLSEYAHVVGFITSSSTTTADIANTTVGSEEIPVSPSLARSASVREPSKSSKSQASSAVGDLSRKPAKVDQDVPKTNKDTKRRTVQVEYEAPRTHTVRGEPAEAPASASRSRTAANSDGPVEVSSPQSATRRPTTREKPQQRDPPGSSRGQSQSQRPSSSQRPQTQNMGAPPRSAPRYDTPRSVSESSFANPNAGPNAGSSIARPNTGGSMTSSSSRPGSMVLPSRRSYGQPVAPTVAGTNAQGHMSQPKQGNRSYISNPMSQPDEEEHSAPDPNALPPKFAKVAGYPEEQQSSLPRSSHKRSSTISSLSEKIFGRRGSVFSGKTQQSSLNEKLEKPRDRSSKKYPPVSMQNHPSALGMDTPSSRQSTESSRRSISFGRKRSGSVNGGSQSGSAGGEKTKRYSLLPTSFSLKSIGIGKDDDRSYYDGSNASGSTPQIRTSSRGNAFSSSQGDANYEQHPESPQLERRMASHNMQSPVQSEYDTRNNGTPVFSQDLSSYNDSDLSINNPNHPNHANYATANYSASQHNQQIPASISSPAMYSPAPQQYAGYDENQNGHGVDVNAGRGQRNERKNYAVLQKNNRKFNDAWEHDHEGGGPGHNAGSSGAARKVMDFFRRRGKARGE